jgi:hypothetical protein
MFVNSKNYDDAVRKVLSKQGLALVAVAFWGRDSELLLRDRHGQTKVICNLKSGATNPETIELLLKMKNVEVKQHDHLHAKVVIVDGSALIGSANFSSNGLNLEASELKGWEEAGLLTQDLTQISVIRDWFHSIWNESYKIKNSDIEEARLKWGKRRATRIKRGSSANGFDLANFNRTDLLDRAIFVTIYRSWLSAEAIAAYRRYKKNLTGQSMPKSAKLPPMYEDWPGLPKEAQLIYLYYGPHGAVRCYGVFTRTHDIKVKYKDGSKGHLAVCRKDNQIMGYPFRSKEISQFANDMKPHIKAIWSSELAVGDEDGKYIKLSDVLDILG